MLNMDFAQQLFINTQTQPWQPSPMAGVDRKPLAREDTESGHATSIVRYAPNSHFNTHFHPKGEEILVLAGIFSDEHGDYPAHLAKMAASYSLNYVSLLRTIWRR